MSIPAADNFVDQECNWATIIASQIWCKPQHSNKEMDVAFANDIAIALREAIHEVAGEFEAVRSQLTAALNRVKELDVAQDKTWNEAIECALAHAETISPENSTVYKAIFGLRRAAEILKDVKP